MARDTHPQYEAISEADAAALLERLASDELSHAVSHDWSELEGLAPFTDVCDPCPEVPHLVRRTYTWASTEGGDILCRVSVYERPDASGHVVTRDCVIRRS